MANKTTLMAFIVGVGLWLMAIAVPQAALAGGAAGCGCVTPPACCAPPTPPPTTQPCCSPSTTVNIPGVNVYVAPSVVVNANVQASASANVNAAASGGGAVFVGGGGGGYVAGPGAVGLINGLNVESGHQRTAFESTRTRWEKVVIQAFCFDDTNVPHPASQVTPDRDIDDAYDGELYRCINGTHMQVTIAKWSEHVSFDGGDTLACAKGDALYHVPGQAGVAGGPGGQAGGKLECRPQKPARDCNERSLLRRFGAGIKILTIVITEKYTAYREESHESSGATAMSLDGGVGGVVY